MAARDEAPLSNKGYFEGFFRTKKGYIIRIGSAFMYSRQTVVA
jgi:hypothetical protein